MNSSKGSFNWKRTIDSPQQRCTFIKRPGQSAYRDPAEYRTCELTLGSRDWKVNEYFCTTVWNNTAHQNTIFPYFFKKSIDSFIISISLLSICLFQSVNFRLWAKSYFPNIIFLTLFHFLILWLLVSRFFFCSWHQHALEKEQWFSSLNW